MAIRQNILAEAQIGFYLALVEGASLHRQFDCWLGRRLADKTSSANLNEGSLHHFCGIETIVVSVSP
jgi:hypothetical protein